METWTRTLPGAWGLVPGDQADTSGMGKVNRVTRAVTPGAPQAQRPQGSSGGHKALRSWVQPRALGLEEETCPAREAGSSSRRWPEHQGYRLGVGSQPLVIRTVLV